MKYIIGAIIGAMVVAGATVYAYNTALVVIDSTELPGANYMDKVWDKDSNVICYVAHNGSQGADSISCLKNN